MEDRGWMMDGWMDGWMMAIFNPPFSIFDP
jgi:hypothetical protein